jgi:hypothetical protein
MTSNIFEKWFLDIDSKMSYNKPKIILFMDNFTTHICTFSTYKGTKVLGTKLKSMTLKYFPSNTTSKLQPMDQGIINNLKVYY